MAGLEINIEIDGLPGFWQRVRAAKHSILLLDYDGTLAPFHPERMQAKPLDGVMDALSELQQLDNTTVALVSGRPVGEIQALTGIDSLIIAGTHGFELFRPGDGISSTPLLGESSDSLDEIQKVATDIVGMELTERKIATVALHTRRLENGEATRAATEFRRRVAGLIGPDLELRDFDGGVEARARGRDKGVAIHEIIDELPPSDLIVYIGDDDTDEDAFRALPDYGVGIKVGSQDKPTAAGGRLDSCEEVLQFLTDWIAINKCQ
ncbi:MAG: trehalose-phosphatase [Thermomicrobiales bacterium]